jgi:hypothetical protein
MRFQYGNYPIGLTQGKIGFSIPPDPTDRLIRSKRPPPTVFIRALETVPTEKVVEVDWFREERCLGWHKYPYDFILEEIRVEGDHFSMFSAQCVSRHESLQSLWWYLTKSPYSCQT